MTEFIRLEERVYLLDCMIKEWNGRLEDVEAKIKLSADNVRLLEDSMLTAMLAIRQLQDKIEKA